MDKVYFYGIEKTEILQSDVQTAVEDYLSLIDYDNKLIDISNKVKLHIYTKDTVNSSNIHILDNIIENLEEEYGNLYDDFVISERLRKAEREFERILLEEYVPYSCTYQYSEVLDLHEWVTNWYDIKNKALCSQLITDAWQLFGA